ncbi:MAG: AbiV family abortive infection protein [Zoogloeaceae bacterium]|nr:AbiV family abortive infection protein [Zoogloeaceae bacterium]
MAAASKGGWSKPVSPELRERLLASADYCYRNACTLVDDAELLRQASRWPTVAALAILAEEEFGKAFMLRCCANQGRWDSAIFAALTKHSIKQALSQGARDYADFSIPNALYADEINKLSLIRSVPSMFVSPEFLDPIRHRAHQTMTERRPDYLKQDALYVKIDKNAATVFTPSSISESQATECLREAKRIKTVVGLMAGDPAAADAWR